MVAPRITRKKRPQRPVQMFVPPPPQTVAPVQPTAPASMFAGPLSNRGTDFVPGASSGAAPAPGFDWASLASGLGAGLLTGKNWGEGVGQGMVLANQFGAQKRQDAFNEQRMRREDERFGFEKQKYQTELDEAAAQKAQLDALDQSTNMFLAPWLNDIQGDEPPGVNLTPQAAMFISKLPVEKRIEALSPIMMPKAQEPYSAIAKAKADLDAGLITPDQFNAIAQKETYIPPQAPREPKIPGIVTLYDGKGGSRSFRENDPQIDSMLANGWTEAAPKSDSVLAQVGTDANGNPIYDYVGKSPKPLTEGQSTGTLQFSLANQANNALGELDTVLTSVPDYIASQFGTAGNFMKSPEYQKAEQSATVMAEQYLRALTGAAAPDAEVKRTAQSIMPQPGDGPEVIAQKRATRQAIIEALRIKAGPGAGRVTEPTITPNTSGGPDERGQQKRIKVDAEGNVIP